MKRPGRKLLITGKGRCNITNGAEIAEEMLYNIFMYGGKNATTVDVFLHVSEEDLNMRLTDNGIPFNPLEYQQEETEFQVHGIEVMKKIAKRIEYLRVIDLNHTMIAIGKNI